MSRLTKEELDELKKLNPPNDPRMFRRFLDTIDALESELALNQAAIVREAAAIAHRSCCCGNTDNRATNHASYCPLGIRDLILAIPTDQPALDRYVAERYITREEHNNIIRMNETVHKRDVAERVREAVLKEAEWIRDHTGASSGYHSRYLDLHIEKLRAAGAPETDIGDWARQGLKRGDPAR